MKSLRTVGLAGPIGLGILCLAALLVGSGRVSAEITEDAKKDFNRGVELSRAKEPDSAIAAYEAAIAKSPDYLQAHINVGALYYDKKQLTDAARHLKAAVTLDSTNVEAYKSLGLIHLQAKDYDASIAAFQRLLVLDPKSKGGWASLAQALKGKGDSKGAIDAYTHAAESDPKDPRPYCNIGNIHQSAGRFAEAIAAYKKSIAADPRFIDAYYNLAISSQQLDQDKCVPDYQAFIKVAQGAPKWKTKVAEVQKIVGEIAKGGGQ
ncbi:MAG: tetratricopeptide repeat protein [candidate division Zixibacteria bacterium]|nr:tetratricopeptide repeat protein [candidate division Zixibacteria bacterium]